MTDSRLEAWIRDEQASLFYALDVAIRSAINGRWSMQAADAARRIVSAARLVGPVPWGEVPWSHVAGGLYQAVYRTGGINPDFPTEDEMRALEARMLAAGAVTTRESATREYAPTIAALSADRERAYIADEEVDQ
jgi:hypothetical protein